MRNPHKVDMKFPSDLREVSMGELKNMRNISGNMYDEIHGNVRRPIRDQIFGNITTELYEVKLQ